MEIWKNIQDNDYYQVSNLGRIKSKERKVPHGKSGMVSVKERILKPATDAKGYLRVALAKGRGLKTYKVHRLVADAFLENHENKPQVNHKDGNKENNDISNLEWVTNQENAIHATENGLWTYKSGSDHHRSALDENQVRLLCRMKDAGYLNKVIADRFEVSISCVKRTYNRGVKQEAN
jgi:hypothetical protein